MRYIGRHKGSHARCKQLFFSVKIKKQFAFNHMGPLFMYVVMKLHLAAFFQSDMSKGGLFGMIQRSRYTFPDFYFFP